jgi:hypothetical protein
LSSLPGLSGQSSRAASAARKNLFRPADAERLDRPDKPGDDEVFGMQVVVCAKRPN